jgi:hypothetical protein
VEALVLVKGPAVVPLCGQWLSFTEGSICTYLLDRKDPMAVRYGLCISHVHIQLDHRNNVSGAIIYHLIELEFLVI